MLNVIALGAKLTCDRAPVAGGQYYWVAFLAPRNCQRFLSYITGQSSVNSAGYNDNELNAGWLTLCGWQASVASGAYISGTLIQGLITLNNANYNPKPWHGTLLFWAVYAFAVAINTLGRYVLPRFESLILVLHVLGFFAILLPMTILGPRVSTEQVFTLFLNEGNWPTQGLSFMIGILGAVFAFVGELRLWFEAEEPANSKHLGADAAIHVSNASFV